MGELLKEVLRQLHKTFYIGCFENDIYSSYQNYAWKPLSK